MQVLHEQLAHARPVERPDAGEQLLVDAGEAILVAESRDDAVERLGGGVDGGDPAGDAGHHPLEVLDLPEVRYLHVVVQHEQVLRLDVQVLQLVLVVHQVEDLGGLGHVHEQLVAGDARVAVLAALAEPVPEVAVGQLHDDHEPAVHDVVAVEG